MRGKKVHHGARQSKIKLHCSLVQLRLDYQLGKEGKCTEASALEGPRKLRAYCKLACPTLIKSLSEKKHGDSSLRLVGNVWMTVAHRST